MKWQKISFIYKCFWSLNQWNKHRKLYAEIYWLSDIENTMIDEYFGKVQTTWSLTFNDLSSWWLVILAAAEVKVPLLNVRLQGPRSWPSSMDDLCHSRCGKLMNPHCSMAMSAECSPSPANDDVKRTKNFLVFVSNMPLKKFH